MRSTPSDDSGRSPYTPPADVAGTPGGERRDATPASARGTDERPAADGMLVVSSSREFVAGMSALLEDAGFRVEVAGDEEPVPLTLARTRARVAICDFVDPTGIRSPTSGAAASAAGPRSRPGDRPGDCLRADPVLAALRRAGPAWAPRAIRRASRAVGRSSSEVSPLRWRRRHLGSYVLVSARVRCDARASGPAPEPLVH